MPLPELLDELFRLYRRHFGLIVAISLIVVLPGLVWTLVTGTYRLSSQSYANLFNPTGPSSTPSFNSEEFSNLAIPLALGALGGLIILPFSVGAVYRAVTDIALGKPVTIGGVLRETLAKYFPLLGLIGLIALFVLALIIVAIIGVVVLQIGALGVILFLVLLLGCLAGGIYVSIRCQLVVAAMMAEDIGPINGLRRSWNLVGGMWWRTLGILFILSVLASVISGGLSILFGAIVGATLQGDLGLAVTSVGSTLLGALVAPITTIGVVLLYFDLRVRKEGLDLDQLAQQTNPGPAPA